MSAGAYFMHRGWMDNPVFRREPYTEREAWLWLIENAAFRAGRVRVGAAALVDLERGQVAASLRHMARVWQWNEPRVRRYLTRLKEDRMIATVINSEKSCSKTDALSDAPTDARLTVISIMKYETYQSPRRKSDAPTDAPTDAAATQDRRSSDAISKKEANKENKENNLPSVGSRPKKALEIDAEMLAWAQGHSFGEPALRSELEAHLLWKRERGKVFKDDRAAFQRWMLNSRKYGPASVAKSSAYTTDDMDEEYRRIGVQF